MLLPTTKKLHALCDGREEQSQSEDELETVELNGGEELPELPWDPMWTQVDFRMQSLHFLKLYGHEYDYGILPNVDLEIKYALLQSTLIEALERAPSVLTKNAHDNLAKAWQTQALWKLYKVAAKSVGLSEALAARQFKAEWRVDPRLGERVSNKTKEAKKYKRLKLQLLEELARSKPDRLKYDARNTREYDRKKKHGTFIVAAVKIDKRTGLELGPV